MKVLAYYPLLLNERTGTLHSHAICPGVERADPRSLWWIAPGDIVQGMRFCKWCFPWLPTGVSRVEADA